MISRLHDIKMVTLNEYLFFSFLINYVDRQLDHLRFYMIYELEPKLAPHYTKSSSNRIFQRILVFDKNKSVIFENRQRISS